MKLRLFRWLFVPLFVIGLTTPSVMRAQGAAPAAQAAPAAPALTESIPFDAAVTTGTLPNGLKYYIRRNTRPEKRVSLQLAVKAGSVDEENDQQGLAHFLEHMAFNGTKRFKPGELIAALESTGARLGPHVNAYTSFDETVYMFELPTDKPGLVEKGLQALSDFAGGMSLDPVEIDKERGVVVEEWRGGLGAGSRLRDQQIPVLYYESKYAERLPIGKPDILKGFKPERLRAFYTKWYRPDRMAFVAVGDITVAEMEAMVRKEFGGLTKPAAAAPDRTYAVPLQTDLLVKMATDPEATQSSVSLINKRPRTPEGTVGAYRRDLVHRLAFQMLNERFDELSRKPDAQFLDAGAYESGLSPTTSTVGLGASVQEGKIPAGLSSVVIEAKRAVQHGFGAGELERAKKRIVALVRPRLRRARQDRERRLRPGICESLPRERAQPGHRLRAQAGAGTAAGHHRGRDHGGRERSLRQPEPRNPRHLAAEAGPGRADRGGASHGGGQRREGRSNGVEGHLVHGGAAGPRSRARGHQGSAPAPGARRNRRPVRQRRRGVVQVDRLQERRSAVLAHVAGWIVAGSARAVHRGLACAGAGPAVGIGRTYGRRPAAAARRQDRLGFADHVVVDARHLGAQQSGQRRDRAAAALHGVHHAWRRGRRLRPDQEEPRGGVPEPRARSRCAL